MRTKVEVLNEYDFVTWTEKGYDSERAILEVLLDIRDALKRNDT